MRRERKTVEEYAPGFQADPGDLEDVKRFLIYYFLSTRRSDIHWIQDIPYCSGTGTDSTVPTNTVQVPITTDNYRYSNGQRFGVYWLYWVISGFIYRTGKL